MKRSTALIRLLAVLFVSTVFSFTPSFAWAVRPAQADEGGNPGNAAANDAFVSGVDLLPASTVGVARIPELPAFCDAWSQTQIGQMLSSPEMQPFLDEQRERATTYFGSLDRKIGLRPEDLYEIASGEVVFGWLSFEEDERRPYAICVVTDIRGMKAEADKAGETIDKDLKAGGATRKDVKYGDEMIRVYRTKPKPGQLKIEEIAITWNDERFIATDRDVVIQDMLDVLAGKSPKGAFSDRKSFKKVLKDSSDAIDAAQEEKATRCWEWYAEPFKMGRILREVVEYDRRDDLDVIELLERQGFEVIEAVGGVGVVKGERFDVLHRGTVLAPGKLTKAAKMLQAFNEKRAAIPGWVTAEAGAFLRFNWELESSFWAAESLVNDALGEDLFRPMIDGIRDDPEGPQIDIAKDFLPNLDNELILITDNTVPAGPDSDRMLVAVRIRNAEVVARVVEKAMEVEPDASKLDVAEFDVWRVERGDADTDDIDAQLKALGFEEDADDDEAPPLLNHWAISVVNGKQPGDADYLMFSSHAEFLVEAGQRVRAGAAGDGFASNAATKTVVASMDALKADAVTFDGVFHPSVSLRAKYELFRKGELKESDSIIANLIRRMIEENGDGERAEIDAGKLPPFEKIKKYLNSGGAFWKKTESGWSMTGFMMAE